MNRKTLLLSAIALAIIALVLAAIIIPLRQARQFAIQTAKLPGMQPAPVVQRQPIRTPEPIPQIAPDTAAPQPESTPAPKTSAPQKTAVIPSVQPVPQFIPPTAPGKPPIEDPAARVALSFVGNDPDAEAYWLSAINDPNLPSEERKDLIEDLNEDGLSDPKHPSPDDLPVILNRLGILEEIANDPMDQVNADAMLEAYKDLQNLALVAMGGGGPIN